MALEQLHTAGELATRNDSGMEPNELGLSDTKHQTEILYGSDKNEEAVPHGEGSVQAESENGQGYPGAMQLSTIMVALCMVVFLCGLDQTIMASAAPAISDTYHALDDVGWWTSIYLLTTALFQLIYGKMFSFVPAKWVYLAALFVFNVGSIVCATSPTSVGFIFGRAIAGVGAAGLMSGAVIIISQSAPLKKVPSLLGLLTSVFGVASISGPFIGGALINRTSWRWCFGINPPIGVAALALVALLVRKVDPPANSLSLQEKIMQFNIPGMVLLLGSLTCLLLALELGGSSYPWDSGRIIALFVVFGVLFIAFVVWEIYGFSPLMVPSTILRSRYMWSAFLFGACDSAAMFVVVTYLPIFFQAIRGVSALRSGIMLSPLIVSFAVASILAGVLTSALGYINPSMVLGAVLTSVGAGLLTLFTRQTPARQWIGYQVLFGAGTGFGLQQPMMVTQTVLAPGDMPFGIAMVSLCQMLGGSIFVAVAQAIFQNTLSEIAALFPSVGLTAILQTGAVRLPSLFTPSQLTQVYPIYTEAVIRCFYVALSLSCLSIVGTLGIGLLSVKKAKNQPKDSPDSEDVKSEDLKSEEANPM